MAAFVAKAGMTQAQAFSSRHGSLEATNAANTTATGKSAVAAVQIGGRRRALVQDRSAWQRRPAYHSQRVPRSPKSLVNVVDSGARQGLSERIASSQFCSCSCSVPLLRELCFLGKNGRVVMRRRVTTGTCDGIRLSRVRLGTSWEVRRRARSLGAGRGPQQDLNIGDFRLDTDLQTDSGGNGSFGDASFGEDVSVGEDLGLADSLSTRLVDESSEETSRVGHGDGHENSSAALAELTSSQSGPSWISKRWTIVLLCFSAFLLCNMDRVNMSIAILPMSAEYHWNPTTVGLIQSSFFWGYLLTQIAGGIWADSIGGKQVLGFGVLWWSLATALTPIAARVGLPALFIVRACMGVGEGVAMPAMNNLLSRWIPVKERSRSLSLVYSGMYLGSVIGLACSPTIIQRYGWPSLFFSFGSVGIVWLTVWQQNAYSSPSEDPTLREAERKLILKSNKPTEPLTRIPWGLLLSKRPVWALIVCHFCHNWGTFILLTWMPTYYNQVLGFNLMTSGLLSVLPWLTMAISANVGGWIADSLVSRGMSITTVRKIMQSIGFLGPAFFLTQLRHITSPHLAVLCMMASQGLDAFSQSGLYSNHQDIGPRYSGILLGLSNTAGVLAGVFGTAATGYILQHGSWDEVFEVAVGLYLFGTVVWNFFSTGEQLFD